MITPERAAEIAALVNEISEPNWVWNDMQRSDDGYVYVPEGATLGETLITLDDHYEGYGEDASFIAESPAIVRELLSAVV